jgi:hypothetical protein
MQARQLMPARAWSPTGLGRQLLGYYDLAAAEDTDTLTVTASASTRSD